MNYMNSMNSMNSTLFHELYELHKLYELYELYELHELFELFELIGSAVLTFIGYKQTNRQTDRQAKFIYRLEIQGASRPSF